MKGEQRAVAGTKYARQIQSANSKVLRTQMNSAEISAWNYRVDLEKQEKRRAKLDKEMEQRRSNHGTQSR